MKLFVQAARGVEREHGPDGLPSTLLNSSKKRP
jgi:hypothetical protein